MEFLVTTHLVLSKYFLGLYEYKILQRFLLVLNVIMRNPSKDWKEAPTLCFVQQINALIHLWNNKCRELLKWESIHTVFSILQLMHIYNNASNDYPPFLFKYKSCYNTIYFIYASPNKMSWLVNIRVKIWKHNYFQMLIFKWEKKLVRKYTIFKNFPKFGEQ